MLAIYREGLPRLATTFASRSLTRIFPRQNISRQTKMNLMTISQSLDEAYNKHKIFPEVVDQFDTQGLLTIEYQQKDQVTLGNTLSVDGTQEPPKIQFTLNSPNQEAELSVKEDDRFLLVLTDPDAPSNSDHKWSQYCHWIVSDLKLNTNNAGGDDSLSTILDFSKANDLVSYQGPAPPEKTGKHRYVFLFYRQDPQANLVAPPDRPTWGTSVPGSGVKEWIKKHGGKSELLAVNFFYAQNKVQE
ncbi:hypothetical protein OXX80_002648 [Metschnikowia pulcherrima]